MAIQFLNTVAVDTNVLYVDTSSDRVGIGTTSPGEKLTLQTQANGLGSEGVFIKNTFAGSTPVVNSKSPFLSLATSTGSGYTSTIYMGRNGTATDQESKIEWSSSTDALSIYVKGQGSYREHVRFGNLSSSVARTYFNGNVGIGTTSPGAKLDVNGGIRLGQFNTIQWGSNTSNQLSIQNTLSGSTITQLGSGDLELNSASNGIVFKAGGATKAKLLSSGNFGIGTTSPSTKLEVNGITTSLGFRTPPTNTNYTLISRDSAGNSPLYVQSANTSANQLIAKFNYGSAAANAGQNVLTVAKDSSYFLSTNVGIGTTNPAELLTVSASDDVSIRINSTKNGTWTTNQKLGALEFFGNDSSSGGAGLKGYINLTSVNTFGAAFDMNFGVGDNATDRMVIKYNGNVGIGTTSPSQKLDVVGNIRSQFNSGDYSQLESNGSGGVIKAVSATSTTVLFRSYGNSYILNNLGIGTTSPASKLQVNGAVQVADDTATASVNKVGALRYRTSGNNSYVDMCMQTGASTYAWVNIVTNSW